jgi:hypothetical protein
MNLFLDTPGKLAIPHLNAHLHERMPTQRLHTDCSGVMTRGRTHLITCHCNRATRHLDVFPNFAQNISLGVDR